MVFVLEANNPASAGYNEFRGKVKNIVGKNSIKLFRLLAATRAM